MQSVKVLEIHLCITSIRLETELRLKFRVCFHSAWNTDGAAGSSVLPDFTETTWCSSYEEILEILYSLGFARWMTQGKHKAAFPTMHLVWCHFLTL